MKQDQKFQIRIDQSALKRLDEISSRTRKSKSRVLKEFIQTAPSHTELICKQKGKK